MIEQNSSFSDFTQETLVTENYDDHQESIVVFFKTFREEMLLLRVSPTETVGKMKTMLSKPTGVLSDQIRLSLFGFGKLDEKKTLEYYCIKNGATIVLKFRSSCNPISGMVQGVGHKLQKVAGKNNKDCWDSEGSEDMQYLKTFSRPLTDAEMEAKYKELQKSQYIQKQRLNNIGGYPIKSVSSKKLSSSKNHSNEFDSTYVAFHQSSTFYKG